MTAIGCWTSIGGSGWINVLAPPELILLTGGATVFPEVPEAPPFTRIAGGTGGRNPTGAFRTGGQKLQVFQAPASGGCHSQP